MIQRQVIRLVILVAVGVFLLGATCQQTTKTVKVQGKKYKPKLGEYQIIQRARSAKNNKDAVSEKSHWLQLLQKFPGSAFVSEAKLRLGILAHQDGQHAQAHRFLIKALQAPLNPKERAKAYYALGGSLLALKKYPEALKALEHSYAGLSKQKQRKALPLLISAARQTQSTGAEIRWSAKQLPFLSDTEREQSKRRLLRIVEGRLTLRELKMLYMSQDGKLSFPFDYVGFRLARAHCHSGDRNACKDVLARLSRSLTPSHPLFTKIESVQRQVRALLTKSYSNKIGIIYPRTGRGQGIGRWVWSAIQLAKRNFPNSGVEFVTIDSQSIPEYAVKAVDTLVFKHGVSAIFGPILSKAAIAAAHRAQQLGVPMMTISVRESLPHIGSYIFRNNLTRSQMGKAIARFSFQKLNHTRYAVFYPDSPFGRIQVGAFWKEIERLGGKVVSAESYAPTTINFSDLAKFLVGRYHLSFRPSWSRLWSQVRVKSYIQRRRIYKRLRKEFPPVLDFDAVFVPETYAQLRKIVSSLVQQDIEFKRHYPFWERQTAEKYRKRKKPLQFTQLLGSNSMYDHRILGLPQVDLQQYVGSIFCARYFPESRRQIVRKFVSDFSGSFRDRFPMLRSHPPIHISAYSYDAMQLLLHVASEKKPKTRKAFRDALLKIRHFPGVTGPLTVDSTGNILAPIRFILIHRKGEFKLFHQFKQLIR